MCVCGFFALFCLFRKYLTLEESSPAAGEPGWVGLPSNPRGLQAALRFRAGQSLLTAGTGLRPSLEILASREDGG